MCALACSFGTFVFAASLHGADIISRTVVSPGRGPSVSLKYLNKLKPLINPYGVPSSLTMGATPPVLLASVQAIPSCESGVRLSSLCITDSKRGEASVNKNGASIFNVFKTQEVCAFNAPARAATASNLSRSRNNQAYPIADATESVSGLIWPTTKILSDINSLSPL